MYANRNYHTFYARCRKRDHRHPNWRITYDRAYGICQMPDCDQVDDLELHEPFGEDRLGTGKMQLRVLLCLYHHEQEHQRLFMGGLVRHNYSMIADDVSLEIFILGSIERWQEIIFENSNNGELVTKILHRSPEFRQLRLVGLHKDYPKYQPENMK